MAEAEARRPTIKEEPDIVAGALEGLAEHRAGQRKTFKSVEDLLDYLEKS